MYTYVVHTTYNVYFNVYTRVYCIPYPTLSVRRDPQIYLYSRPEAKRKGGECGRSGAAKRSGRVAASASARDQRAQQLNKTQLK